MNHTYFYHLQTWKHRGELEQHHYGAVILL